MQMTDKKSVTNPRENKRKQTKTYIGFSICQNKVIKT